MGYQVVNQGKNLVSDIKKIAVVEGATFRQLGIPAPNPNAVASSEAQQAAQIRRHVQNMPKGSTLSVTVTNSHATDTQPFLMFDVDDIAVNSGASADGADIDYVTSFAGNAPYTSLKKFVGKTNMGSIGTSFEFTTEPMIKTAAVKIWGGNIEDYNGKTLLQYLQLAKDTYAIDPKVRVLSTKLWINDFFAISGSLPAGESLTIIFNICEFSNF